MTESTKTLYRKYRPQKWDDIVGQEHIVTTLQNALKTGRIGHAYLFTGPRGTGKTTVARLFATAINCTQRKDFTPAPEAVCDAFATGKALDLIEIDAASHTGVDNIRELRETIALTPTEAPFKVYIIDEVHMLSTGAFNALLKTLEEPPAHAIFILATTDVHKVPDTIISRTQRFDFARFSIAEIISKISTIAKSEKKKISTEASEMIAIAANGGMRDAESLLAQIFATDSAEISAQDVADTLGTTTTEELYATIRAFVARDIHCAIQAINHVADDGYNLDAYVKALIIKLRALLYYTLSSDATSQALLAITTEERDLLTELAPNTDTARVVTMISECEKAARDIGSSVIPQLPLEIAAITICGTSTPQNPPQDTSTKADSPAPKKPATPTQKKTAPAEKQSQTPKEQPVKKSTETTELSQTASTTDSDAPAAISLESLKEKWPEFIASLKESHPSLASILGIYTPAEISGQKIALHVKYELHKEKLMAGDTKLTLEGVLATIFGMPLSIFAVKELSPVDQKSPSDVLTHAKDLLGGTVVES